MPWLSCCLFPSLPSGLFAQPKRKTKIVKKKRRRKKEENKIKDKKKGLGGIRKRKKINPDTMKTMREVMMLSLTSAPWPGSQIDQ